MTDEEFAIFKRLVEKRDREAAQVTVTLVSTAQHCIHRSQSRDSVRCVCQYGTKGRGKDEPEADKARTIIGWYVS